MRKKSIVFLIIFFTFLLVQVAEVKADGTDYKISYDITKFNISNNSQGEDVINIEGWSALSHMDNYGGTKGNMSTYIIAYVSNGNNSWNSGGVKYKRYLASYNSASDYDLYPLRCEWSDSHDACTGEAWKNVNSTLKNNQRVLATRTCSEDGYVGGTYYLGSHCAYRNLGFKISIKINDIIKNLKIQDSTKVKFAIQTVVWYGTKLSNVSKIHEKNHKQDSADIGIVLDGNKSSSGCSIYGHSCEEGGKYTSRVKYSDIDAKFDRKITISGLSDTVKFTAENAYEFADNDPNYRRFVRDESNNIIRFSPNTNYKILQIGPRQDYLMRAGTVKNVRRFQLKDVDGSVAWGYSFWTKSTGNFSLNLEPIPVYVPPCLDNCVGSNCKYDKKGCPIAPQNLESVSCVSVKKSGCQSVSYGQEDGTCSKSISNSNYYYKISVADFEKKITGYTFASTNTKVIRSGNYYYVPIKLMANVTYTQVSSLNLSEDFINKQSVLAGRSFSFGYQYSISSSWNYRGNYDINTSVNNTFGSVSLKLKKTGTNTIKNFKIFANLGNNDEVYVKKGNTFKKYGSYNLNLYKQIISEKVKETAKNIKETENIVLFDDTNDKSLKLNTSDAGTFKCGKYSLSSSQWEANTERTVKCNYKLKKAFFQNNGDGKVIYSNANSVLHYQVDSNNTDGQKSLYYIPVNLKTGDVFKFNIRNEDLSLVANFNIIHEGMCKVVTNNVIHSDKLSYRAIDEKNPFPKVTNVKKYPENWQQYIDNSSNGLNRVIEHSFDAVSYQTIFTKNKLSKIKSDYGDYSSYDDIKLDGSGSSSVIRSDLFTTINRTHCKAGKWNSSCDKVQS